MRPDVAAADEDVPDAQQKGTGGVQSGVDSREIRDRDHEHEIDGFENKKRASNGKFSDGQKTMLPFAIPFLNPAIPKFGNRLIPSRALLCWVVGNGILAFVQGVQDFLYFAAAVRPAHDGQEDSAHREADQSQGQAVQVGDAAGGHDPDNDGEAKQSHQRTKGQPE